MDREQAVRRGMGVDDAENGQRTDRQQLHEKHRARHDPADLHVQHAQCAGDDQRDQPDQPYVEAGPDDLQLLPGANRVDGQQQNVDDELYDEDEKADSRSQDAADHRILASGEWEGCAKLRVDQGHPEGDDTGDDRRKERRDEPATK